MCSDIVVTDPDCCFACDAPDVDADIDIITVVPGRFAPAFCAGGGQTHHLAHGRVVVAG